VSGPAADAKGKLQPACSEPLTLQKRVDKTSPPMAAAAVLNTAISPARLTVRRPGKDPQEYFVVDFPTVTVKSLGQSMVLGDSVISETATLGFTSATITYKAQLSDGSLGAEVTATVPASCP
jgi:type VI protein secretion system component Hcp